jgi:hypothetical protein
VAGDFPTGPGILTAAMIANQNANIVLAGPAAGGAAAPTFRALVAADIPGIPAGSAVMGATAAGKVTDMGTANVVVLSGNRSGLSSVTWTTAFPNTPRVLANGTDAIPSSAELPMMVSVASVTTTGGTFTAYMHAIVAANRTIGCTYIGVG